jgi:hypothetical protein
MLSLTLISQPLSVAYHTSNQAPPKTLKQLNVQILFPTFLRFYFNYQRTYSYPINLSDLSLLFPHQNLYH